MATNTPNLGLHKKDPATDGNETFNIKTMLNDNWDKIDAAVKAVEEELKNVSVPDASLTQKGIVQLSNATDGTRENVAPTEKALGLVMKEARAAKQQASDGKGKVRDAITGVKGTFADAEGDGIPTYDELAAGVKTIPAGFTADATATAGDIRSGKSAYKNGVKVNGSLPTQATGAQIVAPGPSDIIKSAGIYDGAITIKGVPVPAEKLLTGATIAGTAGTMPNRGAIKITPGASEQPIPAGYHNGAGIVAAVQNLIPKNIIQGATVGGVAGTAKELVVRTGLTMSSSDYMQGFVDWTGSSYMSYYISFNPGLNTAPTMVLIYHGTSSMDFIYVNRGDGTEYLSTDGMPIKKEGSVSLTSSRITLPVHLKSVNYNYVLI